MVGQGPYPGSPACLAQGEEERTCVQETAICLRRLLWGFPPLGQCLSFGGWLSVCAMLMASLPVVKSLRDEVGML